MAIGFAINLTLGSGAYTPACLRSASNNLTMASGGSSISVPWVHDAGITGSVSTSSVNLKVAIQAATAAVLNSLAASGAPD